MKGFDLVGLLPIALIFVVMYFLVIRPQSKKAKEHQKMISGLKSGDRVLTAGGLIGTVSKVMESEVEVRIAPSVNVTVARSMITSLLPSGGIVSEIKVEKKPASKKKSIVRKKK